MFLKILIHFTQDKADGANTGKQMYEQNSFLFNMGPHYSFTKEESSISKQMKVLGFFFSKKNIFQWSESISIYFR